MTASSGGLPSTMFEKMTAELGRPPTREELFDRLARVVAAKEAMDAARAAVRAAIHK